MFGAPSPRQKTGGKVMRETFGLISLFQTISDVLIRVVALGNIYIFGTTIHELGNSAFIQWQRRNLACILLTFFFFLFFLLLIFKAAHLYVERLASQQLQGVPGPWSIKSYSIHVGEGRYNAALRIGIPEMVCVCV